MAIRINMTESWTPPNMGDSQPGVDASASLTPEAYNQIITDSSSMTLTLNAGTRCAIQWIAAKDRIVIGTSSSEWSLSGHGTDKPITPTSYSLREHKTKGSKDMQPMVIDSSVMFVNYVGKKLFEMLWEGTDETYAENDLLLLAEHITKDDEIVTMAYQKNPDSIIWATLDDGTLISCTYDREQEVVAWARHPMSTGGESSAGIPAIPPAPTREEAYVLANNTNIVWFDSSWNVLRYDDYGVGGSVTCDGVYVDDDGNVVAGYGTSAAYGPIFSRYDTDLNETVDWLSPTVNKTDWGLGDECRGFHFSTDGTHAFVRTEEVRAIWKFDLTTGDDEWCVESTWGSNIDVDSSDNVYCYKDSYVYRYDTDGNFVSRVSGSCFLHLLYDEEDDRIYGAGNSIISPAPLKYRQVRAINWDGTNDCEFSIDEDNGDYATGILKIGEYIYVTGPRNQTGVGGAWASVWKLDEDLNLVASYDSEYGYDSHGIFLDHDDNIAIVHGDHSTGDNFAGIWILDEDLNYVSNSLVSTDVTTSGALGGAKIPYLDSGTAAIPESSLTGLGVNSVCCIPGDEEDEVWISVGRVIDGTLVRYIERMKPRNWGTDQEDCFFVDSGLTYDSTATDTFTGLDHLEGETVAILGDGAVLPSEIVSGGSITTDESVSVCHVGLPFTYKLKPMRMDQNFGAGTSKGSIKKITEAVVSFYETLNARYSDGTTSRGINFRTTEEYTTPPDLCTGDKKVVSDGGFSVEDPFQIEGSDPLPCTVRAIIPRTEITGR